MPRSRIWLPYTQMKTAPPSAEVVGSEGVRLELADGRVLIDGIASWWTACHGYSHPHIRDAVAAQLDRLPHVMLGGLVHEPVQRLAQRLAQILPGELGYTFFSESGSVGVEVAMKMAIQYWINSGVTDRTRFLSFLHGYHGDTFAAMSVCDPQEGMHALFRGAIAEQLVTALPRSEADFEEFDRLLQSQADTLAALIIEPLVQAAGGFVFHDMATLDRIVAMARKHGLLIIFDEIATGFGRTGSLFACDTSTQLPDIVVLSKALTGGTLPLAATVATSEIYDAFYSDSPAHALMHGPTYSGNPLACAAANASIDLFESEPRLEQVAAIETQLQSELEPCRSIDGVADVRVKGAIGVVELHQRPDLNALRARFLEYGVWIRPFERYVYLMPSFTIAAEDLSFLTSAIRSVLSGEG